MKCPECGADLGEGSLVEIMMKGWICNKCGIRIYKDLNDEG